MSNEFPAAGAGCVAFTVREMGNQVMQIGDARFRRCADGCNADCRSGTAVPDMCPVWAVWARDAAEIVGAGVCPAAVVGGVASGGDAGETCCWAWIPPAQ